MELTHVILTVTNGVYVIGDAVGGLLTFPLTEVIFGNKRSNVFIASLKLAGVAAVPYELWLLSANLATPVVDADPLVMVVADMPKVLGVIDILVTDYRAPLAAFNLATVSKIGILAQLATNNLYAYLKATAVTSPGTTRLDLTLDYDIF